MEDAKRCRRKDGVMCRAAVLDPAGYEPWCGALIDTRFLNKAGREYACPFFKNKAEGSRDYDERRVHTEH